MATSMEVDNSTSTVMASAGTSGSVSVSLHPLVIMNISEHWTRVRAQEGKPKQGRAVALDVKLSYLLLRSCLFFFFVCVCVWGGGGWGWHQGSSQCLFGGIYLISKLLFREKKSVLATGTTPFPPFCSFGRG